LYGAAHGLRQSVDSAVDPLDRSEHEHNMAAVRVALGDESFSRGWEVGSSMNLEEAVEYALESGP
jgi:hypothetical protein